MLFTPFPTLQILAHVVAQHSAASSIRDKKEHVCQRLQKRNAKHEMHHCHNECRYRVFPPTARVCPFPQVSKYSWHSCRLHTSSDTLHTIQLGDKLQQLPLLPSVLSIAHSSQFSRPFFFLGKLVALQIYKNFYKKVARIFFE